MPLLKTLPMFSCILIFSIVNTCFLQCQLYSQEVIVTNNQQTPAERLIDHFIKVEQKGLSYSTNKADKTYWSDYSTLGASILHQIGDLGDRSALSFLKERVLSTNSYQFVKERSISSYIKIADLDESVDLMRHLYLVNTNKTGHWRYTLNKQLIEKFESEKQKSEINPVIKSNYFYFLIEQIINPGSATQANQIDEYLLVTLSGYINSKQRAVIANIYANSGNEWRTNTFNPIKAHFDALPKSEQVDLREQFPDLPPLPSEEEGGTTWVYGVGGLVLIVVCLAIGFRCFKCKNNKG